MCLPKLLVAIATVVLGAGCALNSTSSGQGARYFDDPASAVEQIAVMLRNKDWPRLTEYYDLRDSAIERAELISGEFFYTDQRPESAHPGGFWHYKHPFAPGFEYRSFRKLESPGVVEVIVGVEIQQGGGMVQRGSQTFLMRKTSAGYQILPQQAPTQ